MTMRQAARRAFNREFREMVYDGDFRQEEHHLAWIAFWRGWQSKIGASERVAKNAPLAGTRKALNGHRSRR